MEGGVVSPLISFTVTVSNLGSYKETADLSAVVPVGWSAEFIANSNTVTAIDLNAGVFNSAEWRSLSLPCRHDCRKLPGQRDGDVECCACCTASDAATATINTLGVGAEFYHGAARRRLPRSDTGNFIVEVTNHGSSADTYDMSAIGYFAVSGTTFTPSSVSLAPGATQQVNVTTDPVPYALPQAYELTVLATSQTDGSARHCA